MCLRVLLLTLPSPTKTTNCEWLSCSLDLQLAIGLCVHCTCEHAEHTEACTCDRDHWCNSGEWCIYLEMVFMLFYVVFCIIFCTMDIVSAVVCPHFPNHQLSSCTATTACPCVCMSMAMIVNAMVYVTSGTKTNNKIHTTNSVWHMAYK